MTHEQPQPRSFHADLAAAYSEVEITLGDIPALAFSRPPYGFSRPLPTEELRELAAGRFGPGLDAQLRACMLPPDPPLGDDDRERIVRLAGEAWSALAADPPAVHDPEPTASREAPARATSQAGLWPTTAASHDHADEAPVPPRGDTHGAPAPDTADADPGDAVFPIVGATAATPDEVTALPAPTAPRRTLKVLLTLTPDGEDAYRALVGVGADDCDPLFRTIAAPSALGTILEAVLDAIAAAEDRWLAAPRYPASQTPAVPPRATPGAKAGTRKAARSASATPATAAATVEAPTAAPPVRAVKRQIELFG